MQEVTQERQEGCDPPSATVGEKNKSDESFKQYSIKINLENITDTGRRRASEQGVSSLSSNSSFSHLSTNRLDKKNRRVSFQEDIMSLTEDMGSTTLLESNNSNGAIQNCSEEKFSEALDRPDLTNPLIEIPRSASERRGSFQFMIERPPTPPNASHRIEPAEIEKEEDVCVQLNSKVQNK